MVVAMVIECIDEGILDLRECRQDWTTTHPNILSILMQSNHPRDFVNILESIYQTNSISDLYRHVESLNLTIVEAFNILENEKLRTGQAKDSHNNIQVSSAWKDLL